MGKQAITGFVLRTVTEKGGLFGRKTVTDQELEIQVSGGSVFLRRSTLIAAGDNWGKLKRTARAQAARSGVPFTDETGNAE